MLIDELYELYLKYPIISTDTRNLYENSIFFALKGANFDGNKFAEKSLEKCKYAVVDDSNVVKNNNYILVDNVLECLQELAKLHRQKLQIPFIAITGTNGKTTTKELLYEVLNKNFKAYSTKGNFNNHIGVPLSILEIDDSYEIAVIEMGASAIGEIEMLCEIAQPTHGIITNVGKAHLEGFGSFENIIKAKSELYSYLYNSNATAFVNYDNEMLEDMNPPKKTIYYGVSKFTHCQGKICNESMFLSFKWIATDDMSFDEQQPDWEALERHITTHLVGSYNFENALAAVCVGHYFGINDVDIKDAISSYNPQNFRSQFKKTSQNKLIIDTYNANPTSMKIAIQTFADCNEENKLLIVGDMLELGESSNREHTVLAHWIKNLNFSEVFFVGEEFKDENVKNTRYFSSIDELIEFVKSIQIKDKFILIKASRGMQLEKVIPLL